MQAQHSAINSQYKSDIKKYINQIQKLEETIMSLRDKSEVKQVKLNELEEYNHKYINPNFSEIINKSNDESSFNKSCSLLINLDEEKGVHLLNDLAASQISIPNITMIHINTLGNSDEHLKDFFEYCSPNKLGLLSLNYYSNDNYIDIEYYINSFAKFLKSVRAEIYLRRFQISSSSLSEIVKASCHCKSLILD
jgi:hypothetical protein